MGLVQNFGHNKVTGGNRLTLLRDADGDGRPELRTVFLDHLNSPFGVAVIGGYLYVANTDSIVRYPYTPGETRITAPGTVLTELPGGPIDHHWTKSLVASPDGTKLYVGIGSNSNITENGIEAEHERARIWEVDVARPARTGPYATGLRNPNGLSFNPVSKQLWAVVNERDELGPDLVPDYMTSVKDGAFYGWPLQFLGPARRSARHAAAARPRRTRDPARLLAELARRAARHGVHHRLGDASRSSRRARSSGSTAAGTAGTSMATRWSTCRSRARCPSGKPVDVVTGFIDGDGKARGRPVAIAFDRTGALLIADDLGNVVWRVTAAR